MNFNKLVDENQVYLLYYLKRFKLASEVEFDLIQQTWLALVERPDAFKGQSSIRTYLTSILLHKVYNHFRQQGRFVSLDSDSLEKIFDDQFAEDGHWKNMSSKNPYEILSDEELLEHLEKCKEGLSPIQLLLLAMKEEGIQGKQMARRIEKTETHVRQLFFRMNQQLRLCLEGYVS